MDASEKLKALEAPMSLPRWEGTFIPSEEYIGHGEIDHRVEHSLVVLRNALPQIVEALEAAEFARNWQEMPSDLRWKDFDIALTALNEALA